MFTIYSGTRLVHQPGQQVTSYTVYETNNGANYPMENRALPPCSCQAWKHCRSKEAPATTTPALELANDAAAQSPLYWTRHATRAEREVHDWISVLPSDPRPITEDSECYCQTLGGWYVPTVGEYYDLLNHAESTTSSSDSPATSLLGSQVAPTPDQSECSAYH